MILKQVAAYYSLVLDLALVSFMAGAVGIFVQGDRLANPGIIRIITLGALLPVNLFVIWFMYKLVTGATDVLKANPEIVSRLRASNEAKIVRYFDEMIIALAVGILLTTLGFFIFYWNPRLVLTALTLWQGLTLFRVMRSAWLAWRIRRLGVASTQITD